MGEPIVSYCLTLPGTVLAALALDDPTMRAGVGIESVERSGRRWRVVCRDATAVRCILSDVSERARSDDGLFDQPRHWRYACRAALPRLVEEARAQGVAFTGRAF